MLEMEFDHLGIIVKSIEKETPIYERLGYNIECEIFEDSNQSMRGVFLSKKNSPRIELIQDYSESKFLNKLLNSQNGKIYHIAYKVENLDENIEEILSTLNAKILSPIKLATYYKKVCFVYLSNLQIIELVEYK